MCINWIYRVVYLLNIRGKVVLGLLLVSLSVRCVGGESVLGMNCGAYGGIGMSRMVVGECAAVYAGSMACYAYWVIPAQAGIHFEKGSKWWIPAYAGMTWVLFECL